VILDPESCYEAIRARDRRFEGRFVAAVVTTGVYCRPGCPARLPRQQNVRFFACAAAAEGAGFRACLRCRPDRSVEVSAWGRKSATVAHALRLIDEAKDLESLALQVGVGARQLRRLFLAEVGAPPRAVVQTRRLHFAKKLLEETRLPITRVALAAGYGSLRRFHAAFRAAGGRRPRELRAAAPAGRDGDECSQHAKILPLGDGGAAVGAEIVLCLPFKEPCAWDAMLAFLAARATPGVEAVEHGVYRRTIGCDGRAATIAVRQRGASLELRVGAAALSSLQRVVARVRRMFDLDADPLVIDAHLARDARLRPLVRRRPGVRVPGAWDPWELTVRAILGQHVTVKAATTLAGRIATAFGRPLDAAHGALTHLFPEPTALATADLTTIGLPRARAAAIAELARGLANASISLRGSGEGIAGVRGIGPWTVEYVALRDGACDAFPATDLVLARHAAASDAWRPWRGYAAMHLWLEHEQERR
jgi:AraC family transcriptional regulator, regulatory protein of adaptative response / DNA-3-methyladenine glycosylase II